ncbi:MAG: TetR/AcrR family transcriptional regulator [Pseudomonadota bacterium]
MSGKSNKYHHGDLRRELVSRARSLINTEGLGKLSLRKLAEEAGVAHTALYTHFPTKDALVAAVLTDGYDRLSQAFGEGVESRSAPFERLIKAGLIYHEFCRAEPILFQAMVGPRLNVDGNYQELELALHSAYLFLEEPITQLSTAPALGLATAPAFWASLQGFLGQILSGRIRVRPDREVALVEQYLHSLSKGFGLNATSD